MFESNGSTDVHETLEVVERPSPIWPDPIWLYRDMGFHDDECSENEHALQRFRQSAEFLCLRDRREDPVWARLMLDIGWYRLGDSVGALLEGELEWIVFHVIPREVVCAPDAANVILDELHAFWVFADRELGLENALRCAVALWEGQMMHELAEQLATSRIYGLVKERYLDCVRAGREPSDDELEQAHLDEMAMDEMAMDEMAMNEIADDRRLSRLSESATKYLDSEGSERVRRNQRKRQRKQQKASRQKNRRKNRR